MTAEDGRTGLLELPRARRDELMDAPDQDPDELRRSLDQVAAVDRWLGGERAVRRHLRPWVERQRSGIVLDVGTGNARVLERLVRWARAVGGAGWAGAGVDLHPEVVAAAAARRGAAEGPGLIRGDALALPLADDSVDVALCTLTLHHFGEAAAGRVLREMARVSRGAVVVSDLERTLPSWVGARLLAATVWRGNRLTRHDGPLSVLRSFTAEELEALGREAGLRDVVVRRHFPFRLVLEGRGPAPEPAGTAGRGT